MLDDARRLEVLAAIGIDVYRLRGAEAPAAAAVPSPPQSAAQAAGGEARIAIACSHSARREPRNARLFGQVARAIGVEDASVAWIETAADGSTAPLPQVPAYLLIGATTARICSAQLSIDQQNAATIAVTAEPGELARDGATRRALWHVLKPLARRLRSG